MGIIDNPPFEKSTRFKAFVENDLQQGWQRERFGCHLTGFTGPN
jgi:hypothetical protein